MSKLAWVVRIGAAIVLAGGALLDASEVIAPRSLEDAETAHLRSERIVLSSGGELITYFEPLPSESADINDKGEIPLLAVLKDTLGDSDPGNDRIRQVWAFTYSRPSFRQRLAGGIPFFYHGAGLDSGPGPDPPRAAVDLGNPSSGMWVRLSLAALRSQLLNPIGAIARLTTGSFFTNYGEYREPHVTEAAAAFSNLPPGAMSSALTTKEVEAVKARLELTKRPLGGLVADEYLSRAYTKQRMRETETRGHNWELLRQRAEETGLYLQPLDSTGLSASFAIIWVAERDLEHTPARVFDGKFLNISDPFTDDRLRHWEGYSETWMLDKSGVRVSAEAPGAAPVEMIPLALYALDHPRAPLLLVDFRSPGGPQRREMGLKLAQDITSGVLGLTTFGNLSYTAAKSSWMFIHARHGGATDRGARRRALVEVRHAVATDFTMDPVLRREILSRLERLNINPLETSWKKEVRDAWQQYETLKATALKTQLSRELDADRNSELRAFAHGIGARAFFRLAAMGTLGLYRHHESAIGPEIMAQLDEDRKLASQKRQINDLPPEDESVFAKNAGGRSSGGGVLIPARTRMGQ